MPATSAIRAAFSRRASLSSSTSRFNEPLPSLPRELAYCRFPLIDGPGNPSWLVRAAVETVAYLVALRHSHAGLLHARPESLTLHRGLSPRDGQRPSCRRSADRHIAIGSIGCAAGSLVGGSSDPHLIALRADPSLHNHLPVHDHPVAGECAEIGITARLVRGAEEDRELLLWLHDVGVNEHVVRLRDVLPSRPRRVRR